MCGRFILSTLSWYEYHEFLSILRPTETRVSYNIKPTQDVACVTMRDGAPVASTARWWFVPHWHKGDVKDWKQTTFNARIETAAEKPTFRIAWKAGRCIIPASGYYEWTGSKGRKRPHFITVEQNAPVFFFAGVHSVLRDGTETCSIITRPAEPEIEQVHHRMPVILDSAQVTGWLEQSDDDAHVLSNYGMSWTNRFSVRDVKPFGRDNDGPELIEQDGFAF
ncbi:SOS response-associated peptidase [Tateyamaria sp. ANG-S1]|uniref:SOS response-associated peptidase n=1 Tax=Tateyamaria sp. ANG-S1 TaxID=1577905 RepID=UPI00057DED5C|nr:SOS response-associated peptidase [Tateyamaria sp. ANG-S1]KIC48201.1 hypothetical protein RA29_16745 [Tateyamaria sp. ANG-S1]